MRALNESASPLPQSKNCPVIGPPQKSRTTVVNDLAHAEVGQTPDD